jgi:hypothetical protein
LANFTKAAFFVSLELFNSPRKSFRIRLLSTTFSLPKSSSSDSASLLIIYEEFFITLLFFDKERFKGGVLVGLAKPSFVCDIARTFSTSSGNGIFSILSIGSIRNLLDLEAFIYCRCGCLKLEPN